MFEGRFDIRFPISQTSGKLRTKLEKALTKAGLKIDEWTASEPHYVDENSDFVQTLLSVYTELTRKKGYCMAIGGGTYGTRYRRRSCVRRGISRGGKPDAWCG